MSTLLRGPVTWSDQPTARRHIVPFKSVRRQLRGGRARLIRRPVTRENMPYELGIPTQATRVAALRQFVLLASAPVVGQALGFHPVTTHRHIANAGRTWKAYAPGDHTR